MKVPIHALFATATVLVLLSAGARAQSSRTGATNGFDSSDIAISGPERKLPPRKVKVIRIVALTPDRDWTNAEGRVINAALVAHDRPESEKDKPHIVVQGGIVRLLKNEKVFDVKLETLSREDQNYVEELVYAIQEAEERKAAAAAAAATEPAKAEGEKGE